MDLGLTDQVCLVTGSTRGIGLETARLLAAEGARVIVTGRDAARVEQVRDEVGARLGVACDLGEADAPAKLVAEAMGAVGPIEILVNNVGAAYQTSFEDVSDEQWDSMWQLNVMSYVRCIRAVLPSMKSAQRGSIVNVSSTAGKRPSTGMANK
jgi:3-oxoacyl-[acyl-carrier protein] reductase